MVQNVLFAFFTFLSFSSCEQGQSKTPNEVSPEIFTDKPRSPGYIYFTLDTNNPSEWINVFASKTQTEPILISLDKEKGKTIDSIYASEPILAICSFLNKKCYSNTYNFQPGDSVLLSNDKNGELLVRIKNNQTINNHELNLEYFLNQKTVGVNRYQLQKLINLSRLKQPLNITLEESYQNSLQFIDSMNNNGKISTQYKDLFRKRFLYAYLNNKLGSKKSDPSTDEGLLKEALSLAQGDASGYDSRLFLINYIEKQYAANSLKKEGPNYAMLYDSVKQFFSGPAKDFLLFYCLDNIARKNRPAFKKHFEQFINESSDSIYKSSIIANYAQDNLSSNTTGAMLILQDGTKMEFDDLLKANKGKIVYVDFWASWCRPCIEAMPDAQKLRAKYAADSVAFIYISMDEKRTDWIKSIDRALLKSVSGSYILLNPTQSSLNKKFNLNTIPRYLLYGKDGKLVSQDAPGPEVMLQNKNIDGLLKK